MTVGDLKKILSIIDDDTEVYLEHEYTEGDLDINKLKSTIIDKDQKIFALSDREI